MATIYDQHDKAFNLVSAYVIINPTNGERVATLAFKFPKDGAGRLWCYLHVIGLQMTRGYAGGYGYDKRSAAVENAMEKMLKNPSVVSVNGDFDIFWKALVDIGGSDWQRKLQDAGFTVLQAV